MEQQEQTQPVQLPTQQAVTPVQSTPKKSNNIGILILMLVILASLVTAIFYYLLPKKVTTQQTAQQNTQTTNIAPGSKPSTSASADQAQWSTYTDKQYKYSFNYPQTWNFEKDSKNPEKFTLRYSDTSEPGEIDGEFLSKTGFNQIGAITCDNVQVDNTHLCYSYKKTTSSSAYFHVTLEQNEPTFATAYITRPDGAGFSFTIKQSNMDSFQMLSIIMTTLQFPNEKRSLPLYICPESWSADRKTVTYHSVTFSAEDLPDEAWMKQNCTSDNPSNATNNPILLVTPPANKK